MTQDSMSPNSAAPTAPPTAPPTANGGFGGQPPTGYNPRSAAAGYPTQQGHRPHSSGQPGYPGDGPTAGPTSGPRPFRPVGPILMILGAIMSIVCMFLPWNDSDYIESADGGTETWNGWEQIDINIEVGRVYGTLMLIAFIAAIAAALMVVVAAILAMAVRPSGNGIGALALSGAIVGLVATLGVMLGYVALGATDETTYAMWLFGVSFIPVVLGAIGVLSKKF